MTIGSWIGFGFLTICYLIPVVFIWIDSDTISSKVLSIVVALLLTAATFGGLRWYHQNTASGQRALVDQRSELNNGIERIVKVYTANGDIIAEYKGNIDIEDNAGGYILFDFDGKRYMYYNCFVESIADIN